jgi:hypothetical protein
MHPLPLNLLVLLSDLRMQALPLNLSVYLSDLRMVALANFLAKRGKISW